jgi:SAM-dependent methyltransferase
MTLVRRLLDRIKRSERSLDQRAVDLIRREFTVMPRFAFHQPLDYRMETLPPDFEAPIVVPGEELPLPPVKERMGYSANDHEYLDWGRYDHDLIIAHIRKHSRIEPGMTILDLGCSSGRVLRHFHAEHRVHGWSLVGVDIQARPIEWMRRNFPKEFRVYTGTVLPILPFESRSIDVVYGISIFTHTKFLWDMWLLEIRRVLKPGGLAIQTIHTENAWRYYNTHKKEPWVQEAHSPFVYETGEMVPDYFYFGDISVSQVFWKREIAREFWERYLDVLEVLPPPPKWSFQDWMICRRKPDDLA